MREGLLLSSSLEWALRSLLGIFLLISGTALLEIESWTALDLFYLRTSDLDWKCEGCEGESLGKP